MLKQKLEQDLRQTVTSLGYGEAVDIVCNIPANVSFGDFSTNVALQLSKLESSKNSQSGVEIAKRISESFPKTDYLNRIEVAQNGFINFFVTKQALSSQLYEISKIGDDYGKNNLGQGRKVQVEFMSANPTGPLTLVNGRSGSMGDSLSKILNWSGFNVETEYYVNDTGNQVRLLGESVKAIAGLIEPSEDHYKGEYVKQLAQEFSDDLNSDSQELGHKLADYFLDNEIKPAVKRLGVEFDEYYSERTIHQGSIIEETISLLTDKNLAYKKDGAIWFKSTQFGDEKDRVVMTSEDKRGRQEPTYFMADIAHHIDVLKRGYQVRINILGADHHSYMQRLKSILEFLYPDIQFDIILMQMVKLFKEGQEVRMSKRAGNYVTLDELLDQVPTDAVRFFFLMYAPDSHIDFNLDLAVERSNKNPVYYVQYAHARMTSLLAKAESEVGEFDSSLLTHPAELELIKHLSSFEELVSTMSQTYQVHQLATYSLKLADLFHKFYEACPVLTESEDLKLARLALVLNTKMVLKNALTLMGISAPDKM
jgi:arginyl-tRNA synthetase